MIKFASAGACESERERVPEVPVDGNVRTEVLPPDRLNTVVSAGLAAVALAIAVVGVAGLLAFLVSGRKREFGMRLAIGSQARHLVANVVGQGLRIAVAGLKMPGGDACCEIGLHPGDGRTLASLVPALLAARVDVVDALRAE